jgi:hypothetical protein
LKILVVIDFSFRFSVEARCKDAGKGRRGHIRNVAGNCKFVARLEKPVFSRFFFANEPDAGRFLSYF